MTALLSPSRRRLLATASALPLIAGLPRARANATPGDAATWRVLSRLGYGPTPALLAQVHQAGGARAWGAQQIDAAYAASQRAPVLSEQMPWLAAPLPELFAREKTLIQTRRTLRTEDGQKPRPSDDPALAFAREATQQAAAWRLQACSRPDEENPLLARMTEFWFNHLNVSSSKAGVRPFIGHYLLHAIRPHALARFEDLLLASARHPAMLRYLDQARSVAEGSARGQRGLNENYARELMELHTLGVDGGYTQSDVRELARVLTGWTVDAQDPSGFRFAPRLHDTGRKLVLGQSFASSNEAEGIAAIRMLARHPSTARRVALRMAQWFVADVPPPALVDELAHTFTTSGGDTRALLRTLLASPTFWDASHTLYKTPLDFTCSALAAVGGPLDERDMRRALALLSTSGQPLNAWATPDGYKTDTATWLAPESLTRRADFALALAAPQHSTASMDWLTPYLSSTTQERLRAQPERLRAGLTLASPDFMRK